MFKFIVHVPNHIKKFLFYFLIDFVQFDYRIFIRPWENKERLHKEDGLKIEKDHILKNYIVDKMSNENYSPDVISGRLRLDDKLPNVSTETIYNFIYTSAIAAELGLHNLLPTKRLKRRRREVKDVKE